MEKIRFILMFFAIRVDLMEADALKRRTACAGAGRVDRFPAFRCALVKTLNGVHLAFGAGRVFDWLFKVLIRAFAESGTLAETLPENISAGVIPGLL